MRILVPVPVQSAPGEGGKNPFTLDSKKPQKPFRDFLMNEVRFASLFKVFPDEAEGLLEKTEADAMERLACYEKMAQGQ